MLVAITGASGFVGRHLVDLHVKRGDRVRVLNRASPAGVMPAGIEVIAGDIAVPDRRLRDFASGADVLYHCAANLHDEKSMQAVNVDGTRHLAAAARGAVGRWIQVSSVAVYGRAERGTLTETSPLAPDTVYGRTKREAENIVQAAAASGAFACCTVRPSTIFGCDMPNRSLFQLVAMIRKGLFFFIGRPGAVMNYVHVDSVTAALAECATRTEAAGKIYNLSEAMTLERFVEIVAHELGTRPPSLRLPEAPLRVLAAAAGVLPRFPLTGARVDALTNRNVYSAAGIADELAYNPVMSLEAGLRKFVRDWMNTRAHAS